MKILFVENTTGSFDPRYITDSKLVQLQNALDLIDVTEDGIIIDGRFLQFSKALISIDERFDKWEILRTKDQRDSQNFSRTQEFILV